MPNGTASIFWCTNQFNNGSRNGYATKIAVYETAILQFLDAQRDEETTDEAYRRIVVADRESRHYQLLATGWATPSRVVDALLIHLHIKPNGKVWLLENSTELRVAEELVARGVAKHDIVLGFHPAEYRAFTGYAVA